MLEPKKKQLPPQLETDHTVQICGELGCAGSAPQGLLVIHGKQKD